MKTLTDILTEHESGPNVDHEECACGKWSDWSSDHPTHAAHVAAAYREARTITTLEQLDALPGEVIVRDNGGLVAERVGDIGMTRFVWVVAGIHTQLSSDALELPALVLWLPEAAP